MPPSPSSRLSWIDHVRTLVILLVVHLHACVTYSHVGDWYIKIPPEPTLAAKVPFILWLGHLQSFFMGLLFFISGYFAPTSLARRGPSRFLSERLLRLGVPAALYMLVLHPFIVVGLNPWNGKLGPWQTFYEKYLTSGRVFSGSGPMWFALALLMFSLALVAWRGIFGVPAATPDHASPPSTRRLALFALVLSVATFIVRTVQPIGTNVFNLQLAFFAQYIAFFIAGLHAARHGWLSALCASSQARIAGRLALVGGPIVLLGVMFLGSRSGGLEDFFGGWHWQAFAFAAWEQFAGVGLSLGVLAFFSRRLDVETKPLRWLADRSFGVYVLHAPILIALTMLFRGLPHHIYGLIALLTLAGWVASFVAADVARRIPGARRVL